MRPEDYPAQDAFTEIGKKYHSRILDLAENVPTEEWQYGENPYQSVALYPAEKPRGELIVMIHGGGWTNGYKEWMAFCAPALTARGITAASLGYRLAPSHLWPAGFEDVADGVAEIYRRAGEFGADKDRIFVSGHSAGGHLAALLALKSDWQASRGLPGDVIKGSLPISGTYIFGPDSGLSMRPRFQLTHAHRLMWTWMALGSLALLILLLLSPATTALDRLALYLIPLQLFVISALPDALGISSRVKAQWLGVGLVFYGLVHFIWLQFAAHAFAWLPYKNALINWFFA